MSKAKYIAGAGIVAAGAALSSLPPQGQVQAEPLDSTRHEIIISDTPSHEQIVALNAEKKYRRELLKRYIIALKKSLLFLTKKPVHIIATTTFISLTPKNIKKPEK